jgi:molecular chaperone HscB
MQPNPFTLLNLPMRFDVDAKALHRAFIQQSAANHPDRFTDPLDQADAADRSAAINKAYLILKDPFQRAAAMIALLGDAPAGDSKQLPQGLLMQMMEIREELEEAQDQADHAEMDRLKRWAQDEEIHYVQGLAHALDEAVDLPSDQRAESLNKATEQLNALRYIQRMLEEFAE